MSKKVSITEKQADEVRKLLVWLRRISRVPFYDLSDSDRDLLNLSGRSSAVNLNTRVMSNLYKALGVKEFISDNDH